MNIDEFMLTNQTKSRLNVTCQYYDEHTTDCEYCVYQYYSNGSVTQTSWDFIQMSNIYKSISKHCEGFSDKNDIGYGVCSPLTYETFNTSILCICATNLCNQNLESCQFSVRNQTESNTIPSNLPALLPQLKTSISCVNQNNFEKDSINTSYYCLYSRSPFINVTKCNDYIDQNMVLCLIMLRGNDTLSIGLSDDVYESTLIGNIQNIYYLNEYPGVTVSYNQTSSYFYVIYNQTINSAGNTNIQQICFCVQDNCNLNLNSCFNANRSILIANDGQRKIHTYLFFFSYSIIRLVLF
ncbi:hypothetical protein I4U23_004258 [Adineta vaga]|nr:hypothetical protein I4U23_004258 [Adineta vaga]